MSDSAFAAPWRIANAEECQALGACVASHWLARTPLPLIDPMLTMEHAICVRDAFLARLQPLLGRPVGYKAAAITPPAQRDLKVREPLRGIYLAGMLRMLDTDDVTVPVSYGTRPIVEAKLVVTVRDEGINEIRKVRDLPAHLAYVLPSIELGDSLVQPGQALTAPILTLYNVGARGLLTGAPIPFEALPGGPHALEHMAVTTCDAAGRVIEVEKGTSIMGDPLEAVLWLVADLNGHGVRLRAGDRLGLGALSRVRPTAGDAIETFWEGLSSERLSLTVRFH